MSIVFFTDRDLGTRFPGILAAAGLTAERHQDHFPPDCSDEKWLRVIGDRGWVAVTHDRRIRYKPNELAAVVRHRVILLVVIGKAPFPALAAAFVAAAPRIETFLSKHPPHSSPRSTGRRRLNWRVNMMPPGGLSDGIREATGGGTEWISAGAADRPRGEHRARG